MDHICFDKIFMLVLVIVIIIMALYQHFTYQSELDTLKAKVNTNQCQPCNTSCESSCGETKEKIITINTPTAPMPGIGSIIRDYDYRALADPLVPPLKRDDYNMPFPSISTRGFPTAYKKMGTLIDKSAPNDDPYKFMFLIGRQKYSGADVYDYYVTEKGSDGNGALKFDLPNLRKEVYTGDKLKIDELNKEYDVTIDRNVGYEYTPFVY